MSLFQNDEYNHKELQAINQESIGFIKNVFSFFLKNKILWLLKKYIYRFLDGSDNTTVLLCEKSFKFTYSYASSTMSII